MHQLLRCASWRPLAARQEIQKHIRNLVLTPKETPEGVALEVTGDVALLRTGDVFGRKSDPANSEHYISASMPLTGVILDPSVRFAA